MQTTTSQKAKTDLRKYDERAEDSAKILAEGEGTQTKRKKKRPSMPAQSFQNDCFFHACTHRLAKAANVYRGADILEKNADSARAH